MTKLCLEKLKHSHDMVVTFANTGAEHPATLDFVHQCDVHWGFNTVWLEAKINPEMGKGVRHTVVDYTSAARQYEPYWAAVKKHGIYNPVNTSCTRVLKVKPMESYLKSVGFIYGKSRNHQTAIGIRLDEIDRMSVNAEEFGYIYPLVTWGWTKPMVLAECATWPFDLEIDEHYGNCITCHKKSNRKLLTLAQDDPSLFDHIVEMERQEAIKPHRPAHGPMKVYRGEKTALDIIAMSREPFERFGTPAVFDATWDVGTGCEESCEVYQ